MSMLTIESEIPKFTKFLLRGHRNAGAAVGITLNDYAFGSQKEAKRTIKEEMTVRSAFAQRQIQVTKAPLRGDISRMRSIVGSVYKPRFTGWREQETGFKADRYVATVAARGSKGKQIRRGARLAKPYFHPGRFPHRGKISARMRRSARGGAWQVPAMLGVLQSMRYSQPFIITGHSKIPPGLYQLKGGELKALQFFEPKREQPQRIPWLRKSVRRYMKSFHARTAWIAAARRVLVPRRF